MEIKDKISEGAIQRAFFQYLHWQYPKVRDLSFAIPNGGFRRITEAANLKSQGVTPGVPDVFIGYPRGTYHGLFIEFKSAKGKLSEAQIEKLRLFSEQKYFTGVCHTFDDAVLLFNNYLNIPEVGNELDEKASTEPYI